MRERAVRSVAGLLRARLAKLGLEEVPDPRAREGRWTLAQILRSTLLGLMTGSRSLWEAEALTAMLAPAMRRRLGLPRQLADTTARDALCRVPLAGLRCTSELTAGSPRSNRCVVKQIQRTAARVAAVAVLLAAAILEIFVRR